MKNLSREELETVLQQLFVRLKEIDYARTNGERSLTVISRKRFQVLYNEDLILRQFQDIINNG